MSTEMIQVLSEFRTMMTILENTSRNVKSLEEKIDKLVSDDEILSPEQAGKKVNLSRQTIIFYIKEIGFSKRNRKYQIKKSDLMNWFHNSYKKKL